MTHWEYKVLAVNLTHNEPTAVEWLIDADAFGSGQMQKMLNSWGAEGWELVAFVPARPAAFMWKHPVSGAESRVDPNLWLYNVIFKKPAETEEERKQRVDAERLARRIEAHRSRP